MSFAGGRLALPLVEVPRGRIGDLHASGLGEDDRFHWSAGVVERPRGTAPRFAVDHTFVGQVPNRDAGPSGLDGVRHGRHGPLPRLELPPGPGLVPFLDGGCDLDEATGRGVGSDEDPQLPGTPASLVDRSCTHGAPERLGPCLLQWRTWNIEWDGGTKRGARAAESDSLIASESRDSGTSLRTRNSSARHDSRGRTMTDSKI